jgi:4-hydroxybenzoate polyprenyltransferase
LLPQLFFSIATTSKIELFNFIRTVIWIWTHLLQANVSNQTFSGHEDKLNKPWRPLPSGRVTPKQARILRWSLMVFCLSLSAAYSRMVFIASFALTIVEIVHDDVGFSGDTVLKNLCNVGGYSTFELGAACSMSTSMILFSVKIENTHYPVFR